MSKAKKTTIDQQKRSVKDRCPYQSLPYQLSENAKEFKNGTGHTPETTG